jgi:hypothetical protein
MKRHRTDVVSLLFGLIFVLVVGWWTFGRSLNIGLGTLAWTIAVALILLGGLGLLGVLRGREPASREADPDWNEWHTR